MARLRISILKTILFNLHYFGRKGLKFPVLVGKNFIFKKLIIFLSLEKNCWTN